MNLTPQDLEALAARWIDPRTAERGQLRRVASLDGGALVGRNNGADYSGIAIPNFLPDAAKPREYRLRRDHPEVTNGKPSAKYLSAPGRGNLLFFPVGVTAAMLHDTALPLVVVEGEFKAMSLARLSRHETEHPRWLTVGISGVWNWRATTGKTTDADGARIDVKGPIVDLDRLVFDERKVLIVFDADLESNDSVCAARALLTKELRGRGAVVSWFRWPEHPREAKGIDDLLGAWGPEKVLPLIVEAFERETGPPDLLKPSFTDYGNSERLIVMHGHDLRYCYDFKKWLYWNGQQWLVDATGGVARLAKRAMLAFLHQAFDKGNTAAETFARTSLNAQRLRSMLELAQSELPISPAELDSVPHLLNFANGTVDLRDGVLRLHSRRDFITKMVHHDYKPQAHCPRWLRFLDEIMGGSPDASEAEMNRAADLVNYLQAALGYSLTGTAVERVVFILHGSGANGKTLLLSTVRELLSDYAATVDLEVLTTRERSNNADAAKAVLFGARFVVSSEAEEGMRLSAARLKSITQGSGSHITACKKFENPVTFKESHVLFIDTNFRPEVASHDEATWSRLRLIPFHVTIAKERQDKALKERFIAGEGAGIVSWLVEGARRWHADGLPTLQTVEDATAQWREETNRLAAFLEERIVPDAAQWIRSGELYTAYTRWCEAENERPLSSKKFAAQMAYGYTKVARKDGKVWLGIRFRNGSEG